MIRSAKLTSVRPTMWSDLQAGDIFLWHGQYNLVIEITRIDEKWAKLVFLRNLESIWEQSIVMDDFPRLITWFPLNSEDDS